MRYQIEWSSVDISTGIKNKNKGIELAEDFITREEFNNLGSKVSHLSEGCIQCRTALTADVRHLEEELKETKRDVQEIKVLLQKLSEQVQSLTTKVSIIVAVTVGVINFLAPLLKNWIK